MDWEREADSILPEAETGSFDADALERAIRAERNRAYAALTETEPRWLDDVA
ncbi:MAG: hypothetical protein OEU32_03130 [Acidimicrobiia bacterium]|nr:hypothetical protein [Acidimicrobiia bacterium]